MMEHSNNLNKDFCLSDSVFYGIVNNTNPAKHLNLNRFLMCRMQRLCVILRLLLLF